MGLALGRHFAPRVRAASCGTAGRRFGDSLECITLTSSPGPGRRTRPAAVASTRTSIDASPAAKRARARRPSRARSGPSSSKQAWDPRVPRPAVVRRRKRPAAERSATSWVCSRSLGRTPFTGVCFEPSFRSRRRPCSGSRAPERWQAGNRPQDALWCHRARARWHSMSGARWRSVGTPHCPRSACAASSGGELARGRRNSILAPPRAARCRGCARYSRSSAETPRRERRHRDGLPGWRSSAGCRRSPDARATCSRSPATPPSRGRS